MLARVLIIGLFVGVVEGAGENPIRKVVRLMQDMQKEIETELTKEKELFEKFMCICNNYDDELAATAAKATAEIKELSSKLEEETAEKGQLTEELKSHKKDKAAAETDLDKATTIREKEQAEQEESIEEGKFNAAALGKAIPALEKGASAASLVQGDSGGALKKIIESSAFIGSFDRRQIISFLDGKEGEPSPATAQVIGILKQMKSDMDKSVAEGIANEEAAKKGYAELKAAKDEEIEVASESIEAKEKRVGELSLSISQNTDGLEDAKTEKADSEKFLAMLKKQCAEKKTEWDARFKLRKDEISAISDAIKILNDDDALDVFKKAIPSALMQQKTGFLQQQDRKLKQLKRVQEILATASKAVKGKNAQLNLVLNMANSTLREAQKAAANNKDGPDFSSVVKMIDNMVDVLSKEQADDTKKKNWCVDELQKADAAEKKEQEEMDTLVSTIEEISDEMAGIEDAIKTLQEEVSQLDRSVAAATEQRKKEHAEYTETVSMTEAAIQLVGKAKNRLAKFYNPKAYKPAGLDQESESFVQVRRHSHNKVAPPDLPDVPELKQTNSGGIMGMMAEITHELEMDMAQAKFDEKTAQGEYVELMAESQVSRAEDLKSIVNKKAAKSELEEKLVEAKEQRTMAFDELNNAHKYVAELHSSCDFIVENFDLRKEARANEMESLKAARAVMQSA
jgi:hypothetical protein